jgi:phosphatidylserine/phosphatidylglycerophosphate/cardiolipin synthase-like enzyme
MAFTVPEHPAPPDVGQHRPRWQLALAAVAVFASFALPTEANATVVTSGTITLINSDPHTVIGAPVGGVLPTATPDYAASGAMVAMIDNTPAAASIHLANFDIDPTDDDGIIDALNNAADRGVDVSVVLDDQVGTSRADPAASALSASVHVTKCLYACINTTGAVISTDAGAPGIAHSKFILFSQTKDQAGTTRTNVVADGSQNFNHQQFIIHNNWVVSYDDPSLYTGFMNFWNALDSQNALPTNPAVSTTVASSTGLITTYFYPRPKTSDPVANAINELDCSKGGTIYAESSTWDSDRTSVNNALMNQADAGCSVQLLMDEADGPESNSQQNLNDGTDANEFSLPTSHNRNMNSNVFATHGITVYGSTPGGCRYSSEGSLNHFCIFTGGGSHEKYLVIDGKSSSGATVKKVITGSENFAERALTSYTEVDEEISDPTITQGFIDDFNRQVDETKTINPEKYPNATYGTVNSAASGSQDMPSIAKVAGYTAVAWADSGNPTTASTGKYGAIYVKLMRSDGSTVYEVPVQQQAGANSGSDYRSPSVGIDSSGNAVVAWADDNDGNGIYNIVMCSVTNNGTSSPTIGSRVYVNATLTGQQVSPSLAMTPDGHISVSFLDDQASSGDYQVRLSTFTAATASAKVNEIQVNGTSTGTHTQADVAAYPTTGSNWTTVVVWNDDSDGNGFGDINGRAVTQTGSSVWAEKRLNSTATGDQTVPSVAANADGFVVAWELWTGSGGAACHTYTTIPGFTVAAADTGRCIQVREFNASGTPTATEFEVSNGLFTTNGYTGSNAYAGGPNPNPNIGDQRSPSVAIDSNGDYVVAWQELTPYHPGWDIFARGFLKGGGSNADTLSEYQMNPVIPNNQLSPDVASDPSGNFSLVYTDDWDGNGSTQLMERSGFSIS